MHVALTAAVAWRASLREMAEQCVFAMCVCVVWQACERGARARAGGREALVAIVTRDAWRASTKQRVGEARQTEVFRVPMAPQAGAAKAGRVAFQAASSPHQRRV